MAGRIYPNWHGQLVAHIQFIGHTHGLEQTHRKKNNLTDGELVLFYRQVTAFHQGVDNWKQHYLAWLLVSKPGGWQHLSIPEWWGHSEFAILDSPLEARLLGMLSLSCSLPKRQHLADFRQVYITGVRPGSFTVCPGYEKGADLGQGLKRPEDETLRWSDIAFFRYPDKDGIAARVTFKFLKNQRNPYTNHMIEGKKVFTFLPTQGDKYELDPSAVLLALAYSRGLFPFKTIEELHADDRFYVPTKPDVEKQAVFVTANQANEIDISGAMREPSLNPKLHQMCVSVGLLEHNTVYSFRRTAITEVRRSKGTEFAREVAGHLPDSRSIISYDIDATRDVDITALRLGEEGVSRAQLREVFRQVHRSRVDTESVDLQKELRDRANKRMVVDSGYMDMEKELFTMLNNVATILHIDPPRIDIQVRFETYRQGLQAKDMFAEVAALDDVLRRRKTLRKTLMNKYMKEEKEQMRQGEEKNTKATKKQSKGLHGTGSQPAAIREPAAAAASKTVKKSGAAAISALNTEEEEGDEDEDVDTGAVDESLEGTREEPLHWQNMADSVLLLPAGNEDGKTTLEARMRFIKSYVALASVNVSDLKCMLCALDPTATRPDKLWKKSELDIHLKSAYHTREQELARAAKNAVKEDGKVGCPVCDEDFMKGAFPKHIAEAHPEHF